jgi:hypothetical protein
MSRGEPTTGKPAPMANDTKEVRVAIRGRASVSAVMASRSRAWALEASLAIKL